jgi:hypothetical protein
MNIAKWDLRSKCHTYLGVLERVLPAWRGLLVH